MLDLADEASPSLQASAVGEPLAELLALVPGQLVGARQACTVRHLVVDQAGLILIRQDRPCARGISTRCFFIILLTNTVLQY